MSNELTTTSAQAVAPFSKPSSLAHAPSVNAGAVAIESERAVAEARGQMQLAKMFPRDNNACYAELMDACKLPALARVAFYAVPRAGSTVSGVSIRLAEEIARIYSNFQYGHRELSRDAKKSEVEVFAWDVERNNRSIRQITVEHTRDTRNGAQPLRDQKDIDDKIANVASKQVRGRILALLPKWMVEAAIEQCRATLAGNGDKPISARVRDMTQAFSKFGVTAKHIEAYLKHSLDDTLADELVDLHGIYNSLKDGVSPSEFFGAQEAPEDNKASKIAEIAAAGAAAKEQEPAKKPAPEAVQQSNPAKPISKPAETPNQPAAPVEPKASNAPPEDIF